MTPQSTWYAGKGRFTAVVTMWAVCMVGSGCGSSDSRLMSRHMSNHPRDAAQKRWDAVRSEMKVQLAEQHLQNGRLDEAEDALEKAISLSPNNSQAYTLAARLRLRQGKLAETREMIGLARALATDDPEVDYLAGILAERCGELEDALEQYTAAAMKDSNNEEYLIACIQTLASLGRMVDALELASSREADFDGNVELQLLAARLNRLVGLKGPAVRHLRRAVHLTDDDPYLAAELGRTLAWAGDSHGVISILRPLYDAAIEKKTPFASPTLEVGGPMTINTVYELARAYVETDQPAEARAVLRPVLAGPEQNPLVWCLFARAAMNAGDLAQAAEALDTLHETNSGTAETWLLSALIAHERADLAAVREAASRALGMDPTCESAKQLLARAMHGGPRPGLYAYDAAHRGRVEPSQWITPPEFKVVEAAGADSSETVGQDSTDEVPWPFAGTVMGWPEAGDVALLEVSEGD